MSPKADRILSGAFWGGVVNVVNAVYGFIATPLLIAYFGKSDYGLIGLANSINSYLAIMDLGLSSTNVRFFCVWLAKGDEEKVNKLMGTCTAFYAVIGLVNAVVLLLLSLFSVYIFNLSIQQNIIIKQILIILACMSFINWYTSCYSQLITATENIAWVQKRTLLTKLLMIVVLFFTFTFKLSLIQFIIATHCVTLVILPMTIGKARKEVPYVCLKARFDMSTFKEVLPYTLSIFSFGIFQYTFFQLRPVFLGIEGTTSDITEYQVMNSLAGLAGMVSTVFMGALLPASSRIVSQGDRVNYYRVAYQGTKFISICLCFCIFGLMSINKELLLVYVGEDFLHLVPWLNIWLFFLLGNHNQCISSLILAGTDVKAISKISAFSSVLGLLICWFIIPFFHAGALAISLGVYTTSQILFYWIYYWPQKMKISSRKVVLESLLPFVVLGSSITSGLSFFPSTRNHWLNILVIGFVFALLFIIGAFFLLKKEDRHYLSALIRNKKK